MDEEWIFDENLEPFLNLLAAHCGGEVDPDDWMAISHGVRSTSVEHGYWFNYELTGSRCKTAFAVAQDVGSTVVFVRVVEPPSVAGIGMLFLACQTYRLARRGRPQR